MEQFVKQFTQTHDHVYNYFGEATDRTMQLAAAYTLANKPFSGLALQQKFDELNSLLTGNMDTFYTFRTNVVDMNLAAQFIIGSEGKTELSSYEQRLKRLIDAGFPKKTSTVAAAYFLTDDENHAKRAFTLHKEMKKYHPILTGADDIPISVFITQNEELNSIDIAKLMNTYYTELKQQFKQGEALQLLSQLLVLFKPTYDANLVPYVNQLKVELEKRIIRVTKSFYHLIGILAISTTNTEILNEVCELYAQLIKTKLLKYNKDIAMQIAIQKTIQNKENEIQATVFRDGVMWGSLLELIQIFHLMPINISGIFTDIPFFE